MEHAKNVILNQTATSLHLLDDIELESGENHVGRIRRQF